MGVCCLLGSQMIMHLPKLFSAHHNQRVSELEGIVYFSIQPPTLERNAVKDSGESVAPQ